jgi:hypothetical protein
MSFLKKLIALVSLQQSGNGMSPFRVFIYTMSATCEQNMSSNGVYQLVRFPHELQIKSLSFYSIFILDYNRENLSESTSQIS